MLIVTVISWALVLGLLSQIISLYLSKYTLTRHEATTSQIIASFVQLTLSLWAVKIVLEYGHYDTTDDIQNTVCLGMGYYIYDTIYIMLSDNEPDAFLLYCHHIGSFIMLLICYYHHSIIHPYLFGSIVIPLEMSSAGLNIIKICKVLANKYTRELDLINILFYGLLRIILFPVLTLRLVFYYCTFEQMFERIVYYKYAVVTVLLFVLYIVCCHWFKTMVQKYYNKYIIDA
jgi:hypothetical protein